MFFIYLFYDSVLQQTRSHDRTQRADTGGHVFHNKRFSRVLLAAGTHPKESESFPDTAVLHTPLREVITRVTIYYYIVIARRHRAMTTQAVVSWPEKKKKFRRVYII